jgi:hypothetical protein
MGDKHKLVDGFIMDADIVGALLAHHSIKLDSPVKAV